MKTRAWFAILLVLPWLPRPSKPSIQPNFWLKCTLSLIDISLNIRQYTLSSTDIVLRVCFSVLNTWTLMAVLKQTVLRMVFKVVWKVQEIVTAERYRTSGHVSGVREPTPFLMPTVSNNRSQKSWSLYIIRRWKRPYQRITVQLTNLLQIHCHVLLPKFAKHTLFGPNSLNQFNFLWGQSATLSKPNSCIRECRAVCYGEEIWRLMLPHSTPEEISFA